MVNSDIQCCSNAVRASLVFLSLAIITTTAQTSTMNATTPPLIVTEPTKIIYFREDVFLKMPCVASGNPPPEYKWTLNDEEFDPSDSDGRIIMQPGVGTLVFHDAIEKDAGLYQCWATNKAGTALTVIINLIHATLEPFDSTETKHHQPHLGHSLTLRCIPPRSVPEAELFWGTMTDELVFERLNLTDRVMVDPDGNLCFSNIVNYDGQDEAKYVCAVHNTVRREYKLGYYAIVQPQGEFTQYLPTNIMWHSPTQSHALRGQTTRLMCIFSGNPTPRVDWVRIGGAMPTRSRQESCGQELVIEDVQLEDAGTYECQGINDESPVPTRRSFNLNIESGPFWTESGRPMSVDGTEYDRAEFVCETESIPDSTNLWYLNGEPISMVPENPDRVIEGNKLIFLNITMEDTQVIQCNSSNQYGYEWQNAYLNVIPQLQTTIDPY